MTKSGLSTSLDSIRCSGQEKEEINCVCVSFSGRVAFFSSFYNFCQAKMPRRLEYRELTESQKNLALKYAMNHPVAYELGANGYYHATLTNLEFYEDGTTKITSVCWVVVPV